MRPRFEIQPRGMHGPEVLFPVLGLLFVLTLVIVAVVLVVWYSHRHEASAHSSVDALQIAKVRYAKGEITKTELGDIKKELKAE